MIVNLYIEVSSSLTIDKDIMLGLLKQWQYKYFDATNYDSYTSGPCALPTLEEIEADIKQMEQ